MPISADPGHLGLLRKRDKFLNTSGDPLGIFRSIVLDRLGVSLAWINRHYDVRVIGVLAAGRRLNVASDADHVRGTQYIPTPKCRILSGCILLRQFGQFTALGMIHPVNGKLVTIFRWPKYVFWNIERAVGSLTPDDLVGSGTGPFMPPQEFSAVDFMGNCL